MNELFPMYGMSVFIIGILYYFYNDRMFLYIEMLMNRKLPFIKSRILTFVVNYLVFILISEMRFYLIINWTIFAVFLVLEMAVLYRCTLKMSLFCGLQGALIGLAMNFITRSGAALLMTQPLVVFDSRANQDMINLKRFPIGIGFILAGMTFWWMYRRFNSWAKNEENPSSPAYLNFSLSLIGALFVYLDMNLLIYLVNTNDVIIKLWGMKSGICVLIGYYIGTSHTYTLARLQNFERQSYQVREELTAFQVREEELKLYAFSDCLTGCSSREAGNQAMQKAYGENTPFCVCFADVNNLKPVNDNLGHDMGDRYLSAVAFALRDAVGERDLVCRYGGDEFLLIVQGKKSSELENSMKNVQISLDELSETSEYPFKLWVSYGLADSEERVNSEELLKLVDDRMYENKRRDKERAGK